MNQKAKPCSKCGALLKEHWLKNGVCNACRNPDLVVTFTTSVKQAVITKFLAPTNYRGARVMAKCAGGKIIMGWDHELNAEMNHRGAANWLLRKMDWNYDTGLPAENWAQGQLPSGEYCFVYSERGSS